MTPTLKAELRKIEVVFPMLGTPLVLVAVIYGIRHRTLGEFLQYSSYISLPLLAGGLVALVIAWRASGYRKPADDYLAIVSGGTASCIFAGPIYYAIGVSLKDFYGWWQAPHFSATPVMEVTGVVLATGLAGGALFYFRLRLRSVYGLTEAIIGLVIAGQKMTDHLGAPPNKDSELLLTLLTAGVYLVVRGIDNIHQGATRDPRDAIASLVLQTFAELAKPMSAETATVAKTERVSA